MSIHTTLKEHLRLHQGNDSRIAYLINNDKGYLSELDKAIKSSKDGKYGVKTDSAVYNARNMFRDISEKDSKPVSYTQINSDKELSDTKQDFSSPFGPDKVEYASASRNDSKETTDTYIGASGVTKWKKLPSVSERIPKEYELYKKGEITKEMYNAMDRLSQRWFYANTEKARREIQKLANKVRERNYQIKDFTEEANKQLWENRGYILESAFFMRSPSDIKITQTTDLSQVGWDYIVCGINWYLSVENNGEWDYKASGADWMTEKDCFFYYGEIINANDFGNINYGYTGTILGLTPETDSLA